MRGTAVKKDIIAKMRILREQGSSLPEISEKVGIPKTTVLRYIREVTILPDYKAIWIAKRGGSKNKKLLQEEKALKEAEKLLKEISLKERMLFLSALYWAEGSKADFGLSNTDPDLIRVFVEGLREVFGITNDRLRVSVRIYEDLDRDKCLSFWSNIVNIPKEKFVNVNVLPGKKKGKLEYGMCRIRVSKGGELLKKIKAINKVIVNSLSP
jgi:hypothetical protein